MKSFLLLCAIAMNSGMGKANFVILEGDPDLLQQVRSAIIANREQIRTWQGEAVVDSRSYASRDASENDPADGIKAGTVSFVRDERRQLSKWTDTEVLLRGDPSGSTTFLHFWNLMRREDGLYQYMGKVDYIQDQTVARGPTLVIWPTGRRASAENFDPMSYLGKTYLGHDIPQYLDTISSLLENSVFEPKSEDDQAKARLVFDRTGDIVRIKVEGLVNGITDITDEYQFDLSQGGNAITHKHIHEFATAEQTATYEQIGAVWVPRSYQFQRRSKNEKELTGLIIKRVEFAANILNKEIDDSVFTIENLGIREGQYVVDRRIPESPVVVRYGIGPVIPGCRINTVQCEIGRPVVATQPSSVPRE